MLFCWLLHFFFVNRQRLTTTSIDDQPVSLHPMMVVRQYHSRQLVSTLPITVSLNPPRGCQLVSSQPQMVDHFFTHFNHPPFMAGSQRSASIS
jgi:hypothetical protein